MGQRHNINPDQLTMFERAGDLANPKEFYPGDAYGYENDEDGQYESHISPAEVRDSVKREKLTESHEDGLYEDIAARGVKEPVDLVHKDDLGYGHIMHHDTGVHTSRGLLWNGHHRVYSQEDIDPKAWVPVNWVP